MSSPDPRWSEYYSITKSLPPSKLLLQALDFVAERKTAIDLGAGALKDTRHLLAQGFTVLAIDKGPISPEPLTNLDTKHFKHIQTPFEDFSFPSQEYDLANAQFSLPFIAPENFNSVLQNIKDSLKDQGIFCGQLFGIRDEWQPLRPHMTFHTIERARSLFSDMEILFLNEDEKDGMTANGTPKHWHIFNIIARRIY